MSVKIWIQYNDGEPMFAPTLTDIIDNIVDLGEPVGALISYICDARDDADKAPKEDKCSRH